MSQAVAGGSGVDALVAQYAPMGRQLRRQRQLKRIALALLVPILALVAILLWQSRALISETRMQDSDADRVERALSEFKDLKSELNAEKGAVTAQRTELARQLALFSQRNEELAEQLVAITAQRDALAEERRQFEVQQVALASSIEKAEQQRRALKASTGPRAEVDRQLAEIERQKRLLEEQQRQFLDQGRLLAEELGEINRQRSEIERQRQAIEAQQAEVRKLLDEVNKVGDARRQKQDVAGDELADDQADHLVGGEIATMAAVDSAVLGGLRGGVDIGQDYSFAIGITRTTSINGIEQFSSAMYINELRDATGTGSPTHSLQIGEPLIVQNGTGNFVDAGTLANMSQNYQTIIQNTLDNQTIRNDTVLDISLQNVSTLIQGMDLSRVARDGLSLPP